MNIHKGEQYVIPFEVTVGEDAVTPASVDGVRIQIEDRLCEYPNGELEYDTEDGTWLYPLTEEQSSSLYAGERKAQVAVKYGDDIVMSDIIRVVVMDSIIKRKWTE